MEGVDGKERGNIYNTSNNKDNFLKKQMEQNGIWEKDVSNYHIILKLFSNQFKK